MAAATLTAVFMQSCAAVAGHYTSPTPTCNGTASFTGTNSITNSYSFSPSSDGWSGYVNAGGGAGPAGGTAKLTGTITTTYTWQPDYAGDPPPETVVVQQSCTVIGSGQSNPAGSASGNLSNGLGATQVIGNAGNPFYNYQASSTTYTVKPGGQSVTVSCSPSGTVKGMNGSFGISSQYSVSLEPVYIDAHGTMLDTAGYHIMTGQQVVNRLVVPYAISVSGQSWSATGSLFKDYVIAADRTSGTVIPLAAPDYSAPTFPFYTLKDESITVTCSATARFPDGTSAAVSADKGITSHRAIATYWTVDDGAVQFTSGGSPVVDSTATAPAADKATRDGFGLKAAYNSSGIWIQRGQDWRAKIDIPTLFQVTGGQGAFVQKYQPARYASSLTDEYWCPEDAYFGLDNTYPYDGPFGEQQLVQNGTLVGVSIKMTSGDSPNQALEFGAGFYNSRSEGDQAQTWTVFQPFANVTDQICRWVPLQCYNWSWTGDTVRPLGPPVGYYDFIGTPSGGKLGAPADTTSHPEWTHLLSNANLGLVPHNP